MAVTGSAARLSARPSAPAPSAAGAARHEPGRAVPKSWSGSTETFELVDGGRAMGMLVAGDAGVGKSRIVEEFCDGSGCAGPSSPRDCACRPTTPSPTHPSSACCATSDAPRPARPRRPRCSTRWAVTSTSTSLQRIRAARRIASRLPAGAVRQDGVLRVRPARGRGARRTLPRVAGFRGPALVGLGQQRTVRLPHPQPGRRARPRPSGPTGMRSSTPSTRSPPWLGRALRHPRVRKLAVGPLDRAELASSGHQHARQARPVQSCSNRCGSARWAIRSSPRSCWPRAIRPSSPTR